MFYYLFSYYYLLVALIKILPVPGHTSLQEFVGRRHWLTIDFPHYFCIFTFTCSDLGFDTFIIVLYYYCFISLLFYTIIVLYYYYCFVLYHYCFILIVFTLLLLFCFTPSMFYTAIVLLILQIYFAVPQVLLSFITILLNLGFPLLLQYGVFY